MSKKNKERQDHTGARLVSSALLGLDFRVCMIGGKRYVIHPPTIAKIAGAALHLTPAAEAESVQDFLSAQGDITSLTRALSYLIQGDDTLAEDLATGTVEQVTAALAEAYSMIDIRSFKMLSTLARNVARMVANPK